MRQIGRLTVLVLVLIVTLALLTLRPPTVTTAAADERESVTGHVDFVDTVTNLRFRYSVNAIRHQDGSVSGEFENHVVNATTGAFVLRAHVGIVCFTVNGNVARIGGIIEQAAGAGPPPGLEGFITVVDNGEGGNAVPDLASPPGVAPGSALAHCTTGLPRPLFPVEHGNVQVRP
jgi:hypothetical protein